MLYPIVTVSHMIPMVQLAKLFLNHGVSVDIAVMNPPIMLASTTKLISKVSSTNPEISFTNMLRTIQSDSVEFKRYLQSSTSFVFMRSMLQLSSASPHIRSTPPEQMVLPCSFTFQNWSQLGTGQRRMLEKPQLSSLSIPLLHASDAPSLVLMHDTEGHRLLINVFWRLSEAKGILINTFESLEPHAVKTLNDG